MKKASVRELRYRFFIIEELLRDSQEIHITKRARFIARLLPPAPTAPIHMPDFKARRKKIFGKKKLKFSGADLAAKHREERV